jgi:Beta-lactamase
MATISTKVVDDLKQQIDAVTADPEGIPGTVYCAVNKNGDLIFQHASGVIGKGKQEKMSMDTVFWIASCTKMITGIACMQLVEQGKLALDDGDLVEKLAPVSGCVQQQQGGGRPCSVFFLVFRLIALLWTGHDLLPQQNGAKSFHRSSQKSRSLRAASWCRSRGRSHCVCCWRILVRSWS